MQNLYTIIDMTVHELTLNPAEPDTSKKTGPISWLWNLHSCDSMYVVLALNILPCVETPDPVYDHVSVY